MLNEENVTGDMKLKKLRGQALAGVFLDLISSVRKTGQGNRKGGVHHKSSVAMSPGCTAIFYHLNLCMVSNDEIPSPLDIRIPCLSSYLLGPEISSLAWLIIALSPPKGWALIFCCGSKFPLLCHLLGLVCHHSLFTALGKCGTNWGSSLFLQEVAVLEG